MAKIFRSRTKAEEKEDSKLYHVLEDDISKIRERLKIMYMADKERSEDFIHGMVVRLDRIDSSLSDYLFDGESARRIMETMDNHSSEKKAKP
jgi:hypothetical protein